MPRGKTNKKSGWQKRDRQYRLAQNAKASENRRKKQVRRVFDIMAGAA